MATEATLSMSADVNADYLRTVESSTCLLLAASPSPTPEQPHPLSNVTLFTAQDDCMGQLPPEDAAADSSSSGDSASVALRHDPVSAQLINNISMLDYRTLSKEDRLTPTENTECKLNGNLSGSSGKLPKLVEWNWVMVRKVLLWVVVSALAACSAAVVAMIVSLPASCEPHLPWYQGSVIYEVFTASFENSNNDAYGDMKGLRNKLDYIEDLGASAIRLNSIYEAIEYPERYAEVTDAMSVARNIGTLKDFQDLVSEVHRRNMSLVLDFPVTCTHTDSNGTTVDQVANALTFWSSAYSVDGFYLKDFENCMDDPNFENSLRRWQRAVGYGKILIVSYETLLKTSESARSVLLSKVDLVDIQLDVNSDTEAIRTQIKKVLGGPLFEKPSNPWAYWNLGDVRSERLGDRRPRDALALMLMMLSLPGTIGVFYGDEIGLRGLAESNDELFSERHSVHGLVAMRWAGAGAERCAARGRAELPWNCGADEPDYARLSTVKAAIELRKKTPSLYTSWAKSDASWAVNAEVREAAGLVVERWLPRRHSYVYVGNPTTSPLLDDLTSAFYAGRVVAATNATRVGTHLYFDYVHLRPHEAIVVQLEK